MEFAYTLYVEGMCELCGGPRSECRNDDNAGAYEAAETTCHKQAAVEEKTGAKDFKPEPGQRFYARPIDESVIQHRTFAPLPYADNRGDETGESDERSEPA